MTRFAGRTVLITGASRGLGADLARAFAAEGARVGVGFRVQEVKALTVVEDIFDAGGDALAVRMDVRDRAAIETAVSTLGQVDVLVNNAGLVRSSWFALDDPAAWDEVVEVNLLGAANCCRAVVRGMIGRGRGAIVNVASVAGLRAPPGESAYAASKAGLLALTRALAAELAERGVRVNAVVPGFLDVGMALRMSSDEREKWTERIPMGRVGTAAETCRATLFLASDEASYITGQALAVDGGLSL